MRAYRRRLAARVQVWLHQLPNCVVDNWGVYWQLRYTLMTIKRHEAMILIRRRRSDARQKFSPAIFLSPIVVAKFIFFAPNLLFLHIWRQWRLVSRTLAFTHGKGFLPLNHGWFYWKSYGKRHHLSFENLWLAFSHTKCHEHEQFPLNVLCLFDESDHWLLVLDLPVWLTYVIFHASCIYISRGDDYKVGNNVLLFTVLNAHYPITVVSVD